MNTNKQIDREHRRLFYCDTCGLKDSLTTEQLKTHLREVHQVESLKGSKRLIMALDGDRYINTSEVELSGVKVTLVESGPNSMIEARKGGV